MPIPRDMATLTPALSQRERGAAADAELANLLEQMADELRVTGAVDVGRWQARFPEVASEISRLVPTLQALVDFSTARSGPSPVDLEESFCEQTLGDFEIRRELGRGGMGIVYEARQLSLNRRVALKILPLAAVLDPRTLQRFKNEAQAAAALDHPHIVDVYGVGCERGVHYYAMRLIDGCTLAELIAQFRLQADRDPSKLPSSLSPPAGRQSAVAQSAIATVAAAAESTAAASAPARRHRIYSSAMIRSIIELAIDVAEGLSQAHEQGIVHRDIKPSNLMLDGQGKVWITDFGLAQIESNQSLTMTGDLVGTLRYMSPEQALAKRVPVDQRSDIYSLGVTLYELLTLRPVFAGDDRATLIHAIAFSDPIAPRRLNPQIPSDLETILLKMLEKDPHGRYASAGDLAEDLRRFVENKPIAARRPGIGQRLAKWSVRNRSLVTAITLMGLAVVAVAGSLLGWWARDAAARRLVAEQVAGEAVQSAEAFRSAGQWSRALAELERAEAAFTGYSSRTPLHENVIMQRTDAKMILELDQARLLAAALAGGDFDFRAADVAFARAFRAAGMAIDELPAAEAARLVEQRAIRAELADALTHWSVVRRRSRPAGDSSWHHLLAVARRCDGDPWRNRLRDVFESGSANQEELADLAASAPIENLPSSALLLLVQAVAAQHIADPRLPARLREVQRLRPSDFWTNIALARFFETTEPPGWNEVVRYYEAALAVRPGTAAVHNNLGAALQRQGQREEAMAHYERAIALAPDFVHSYANLGHALYEGGKHEEAIIALRKALMLRGDMAIVHRNLGVALFARNDFDPAIAAIERAIEIAPSAAGYHYDLGVVFQGLGDVVRAVAAFRREVELQPKDARAHNNLGSALERLGQRDEALAEYRRACELRPSYLIAQRNLGVCLQRLGRFAEAQEQLERGRDLAQRSSESPARFDELLNDLQRLMRAEAQLPALILGDLQPEDAAQLIDAATVCRYQRRYSSATKFYWQAFAQDGMLADRHRYDAACTAALAAQRRGDDTRLTDAEQKQFRQQARDWLHAELVSRRSRLQRDHQTSGAEPIRAIAPWQIDPDLTSVREKDAIQSLPDDESQAWRQLWSEVDHFLADARKLAHVSGRD